MKTAEGTSSLVTIILAIATLIVISGFAYFFFQGVTKSIDDTDCAAQIQTHATILRLGRTIFLPIDCPTTEHIYTRPGSSDQIKKDIADEMAACWKRWGRGEGELFSDEGMYCNYCSYIDFTATGEDVTGISSYLSTTPYKDTGETYMHYLQPTFTEEARNLLASETKRIEHSGSQETYTHNQPYAILFAYAKGDNHIRKFSTYFTWSSGFAKASNTASLALGAVAGGATGAFAITVLGIGTGGTALIVIGTAGAVAVGLDVFLSAFDPEDYTEHASTVVLMPLSEEHLKQLGCTHSWATRERPEGFYTHHTQTQP
ncbi:MAG: hypothetical protein HC945_00555 [Nitrosarchaeum sp.]|nr:hypothetical protein [Nitrosarchaeum sp.]